MPYFTIAVLTCLFYLAGCDSKTEPKKKTEDSIYNLTVNGSDFSPYQTHDITMALIERDAREIIAQQKITIGADGKVATSFPDALTSGHNYYVAYFADVNKNGTCDAPPADHTWTVKLDSISADEDLALTHNFGSSDNCHMFNAETLKGEPGTAMQLTGTIVLDSNITDATNLTAGQTLKGAAVFVQGYPDQEAITDSTGAFTLAITIPVGSDLTATPLKLVTWYTQKDPGQSSWEMAQARFGMISEITGTSGAISMGTVSLTRTNRVKVMTKSAVTDLPVPSCFLKLSGFDFQAVSNEASAGAHEIDYLPAATYELTVNCPGYELKLFDLEVKTGTDSDKWVILPEIKLTPL